MNILFQSLPYLGLPPQKSKLTFILLTLQYLLLGLKEKPAQSSPKLGIWVSVWTQRFQPLFKTVLKTVYAFFIFFLDDDLSQFTYRLI